MIQAYKLDKVTCYKHISSRGRNQYFRKTIEARALEAAAHCKQRKLKAVQDKLAQFGPPNQRVHINGPPTETPSEEKRRSTSTKVVKVDKYSLELFVNEHPGVIGKRVSVKYGLINKLRSF